VTDIRIITINQPVPVFAAFDWMLRPDGGLDESNELASAMIVALATDRLALPDDELPGLEPDDNRRGWWGDLDADEIWGGWPIGSRLWLLERGKITDINYRKGSTLVRAENYTLEAMQPFIDQRLCTEIVVQATRNAVNYSRIDIQVTVSRGPLPTIALRFDSLWQEEITGAQGST
jgi:phage gp46-like protein